MKIKLLIFLFLLAQSTTKTQSFFDYDWKTVIDTTWVQVFSKEEMLEIFDSTWSIITNEYACFQYLNTDWDSLKQSNREEIQNGVSRGRFTAILNHFGRKLEETHTFIGDVVINQQRNPKRGTPVISHGGWGNSTHFGAGLSPLPDSSLLVYKVMTNHPLGLKVGDIILGYEGISWKILYKMLLEMEFPTGHISVPGSNKISITEEWLKGAGENWHLFETIDIKKYGTNDTIHLPTKLLENQEFDLYHSDQIPVSGIDYYTNINKFPLSWGVVENTNIGYIYIWNWLYGDISNKFYFAIDSLINILNVDGLILDVRANNGGIFSNTNRGLDLLFHHSPSTLGLSKRISKNDLYLLSSFLSYTLNTDTAKYFDGPIAVLTGSSTISAADFFAHRLKEHPNTKIFGRPPSGSYSSSSQANFKTILVSYANSNGYNENEPNKYLSHTTIPVDFEVYFIPEDVANGVDTIVKEALKWIENNIVVSVENIETIGDYSLLQNYPNPFNPKTTIKFIVPKRGHYVLKVYDALGQVVKTLANNNFEQGSYSFEFRGNDLSSGIYFYTLSGENVSLNMKMILLK